MISEEVKLKLIESKRNCKDREYEMFVDDCILENEEISDHTLLLLKAIQLNLEDIVHLLLDNGADPDARSYLGKFVLMEAVFVGSKRIVSLLLEYGANPLQLDNNKKSARYWAMRQFKYEIAALLKEAEKNYKSNEEQVLEEEIRKVLKL